MSGPRATASSCVDVAHLVAMTDDRGLFEHADHVAPRLEHGYCTDDNARLLVVASREPDSGPIGRLGRVALAFCREAMVADGRVRNRMDRDGKWTDTPGTDDCWGRCLWGLGAAATHHDDPSVRAMAHELFRIGARQRSPWTRSMAFAALGAADLLSADPTDDVARAVLIDTVLLIGRPRGGGDWCWPEDRLTYANAVLAEALIAAGALLDDGGVLDDGLAMLEWLLERESRPGWLSVTSTGGRSADADIADAGAARFDQQPIEVAAIADACWRAYTLTLNQRWVDGVLLAEAWFDGVNDAGAVMHDASTGGGYDGLRFDGVNLNEGAESTLALVSTRQRARSLDPGDR